VDQTETLSHRHRDENAARHAGILALYDWCWGDDVQWLIGLTDDDRYYSHDHGYFFPDGEGWTEGSLMQNVHVPHQFADNDVGISPESVKQLVIALRAITPDALRAELVKIPESWPVTDSDLECLGYFLEQRAPEVADRLLARFGVVV